MTTESTEKPLSFAEKMAKARAAKKAARDAAASNAGGVVKTTIVPKAKKPKSVKTPRPPKKDGGDGGEGGEGGQKPWHEEYLW